MSEMQTTMKSVFLSLLIVSGFAGCVFAGGGGSTDYCLIGAGPGGMQVGYFLERAGRDYIIFEKGPTAGTFYTLYPRHRTLISINKIYTGKANKEFNFRHDWNSLISDDPSLRLGMYTDKYFPDADTIVQYFQDFANNLGLNIKYRTEIVDVSREEGNKNFQLKDQNGTVYSCRTLVVSTGIWVPNIPKDFIGLEYAEGYESMSIDPMDYVNKAVLVLGKGNAGFETANHLSSKAAFVHIASRTRTKNAYQTHYVGDLRAINNNLLDGYQLKSLDGLFETSLAPGLKKSFELVKDEDGKIYLTHPEVAKLAYAESLNLDKAYDVVLRCMGFKFDFSIFNETARPQAHPTAGENKYPDIHPNYESINVPGMYFAGTNTHARDFRKSAGAFIHGFRYTARALFHHLQWRYEGIPWPSVTLPATDLLNFMARRINEASGNYQMFGVLVDVALIRDNYTVVYLQEVPLHGMYMFKEMTGHEIGSFIIWNFEYGPYYSGASSDVLHEDRFVGNPVLADQSNFLHPVLYHWKNPPKPDSTWISGSLPTPDHYHHIVEDFFTDWSYRRAHLIPLRRFLEAALQADLRDFFAETCFELILTHGDNVPLACKQHYLQGVGISSSDKVVNFGPSEAIVL